MSISCIIVDDEPIARDIIKDHLEKLPDFEIKDMCINAMEAYEALYTQQVDVIFLDIQMPRIAGTEFLRSLRNPPYVVFTTAYPQFAVEGFDLNSVDYLVKPITFDRFLQAAQKLRERMATRTVNLETGGEQTFIFIRQNHKLIRVNFEDIVYVEAQRDFSMVYLANGATMMMSMNIGMVETLLPQHIFLRIHRSYIVQLIKIKAIAGNLAKTDLVDLPIGPNYREILLQKLNIFM
ncbi:MAG TPA: response regulator transcription factor [Pseudosphingobacterium sp.]|nr:response regulator transcription factor [Pseudosphingobacterium sp.]